MMLGILTFSLLLNMILWDIDSLFHIVVGFTMFLLGTAAIIKIYRGSKIPFAFTLTGLTCTYGV